MVELINAKHAELMQGLDNVSKCWAIIVPQLHEIAETARASNSITQIYEAVIFFLLLLPLIIKGNNDTSALHGIYVLVQSGFLQGFILPAFIRFVVYIKQLSRLGGLLAGVSHRVMV